MRQILIIGGDSDFNLGDAAILGSLCECLSASDATLEIVVTSKQPFRSKFQGVARVIQRGPRGFARLLRVAHESALVIIGGGGLFQDDDSRIKMPFWAGLLGTLKLSNTNIIGHSLGAGPLRHAESRQFARAACSMLRTVSVRDHFAQQWLAPCAAQPVPIVPDPAFMLTPAPAHAARELIRSTGLRIDKPIIGVALRRWFHRLGGFVPHRIRAAMALDSGQGERNLDAFLNEMASALLALSRLMDASILMLPTYNVAHENDAGVCARLAERLPSVPTATLAINDPRLYKAVTGQLALMVASRMHPLILASGMNTPIVGLAYNGKFDGLFELLQLPYRPLWLNELAASSFASQLEQLALEALKQRDALGKRAEYLGALAREKTAALLAVA